MPTTLVANTFPSTWTYGQLEQNINASLLRQIDQRWPHDRNMLVGTTWMGPGTDTQFATLTGQQFDRLIITSTVDAALRHEVYPLIDRLTQQFGFKEVLRVGNFDTEYDFNVFAVSCLEHFKHYETDDLILRELRWRYCAYNRKPYPHRIQLVRELVDADLESQGVITLGRAFPQEPDHGLYRTIGERDEDYVAWGHWYTLGTTDSTPHEIPHDLFSLHNFTVWQHHFLHIVGATAAYNEPDTFINQINFKPLIGLRPFVINGQTKQYDYLRRNGFRTFNHYWPQFNLEINNDGTNRLALVIRDLLKWLTTLTDQQIIDMYQSMLPDLLHNRQRWFEYAREQQYKINHLFQ